MSVILLGLIGVSSWISQSLLDLFILALTFYLFFKARKKLVPSLQTIPWFLTLSFVGYFVTAVLGYIFNARVGAQAGPNLVKMSWMLQLFVFIWAAQAIDWSTQLSQHLFILLKFFIWMTLLPSIYSFNIYLLGGVDVITLEQTGWRIVGLVNSATYHGLIGGMIFAFCSVLIALRWRALNQDLKIMSPIFLLLTFASTVLTLTRGVWVSLITAFFTFLVTLRKWKILLAIIVIAVMSLFTPLMQNLITHRAGSDGCRVKLFTTHVRIFQAYPLLGIGYRDNLREIKDFWPESEIGRCGHLRDYGNHAHNQYLNVLATTGVFGFIFFLIFNIYFLVVNILLVRRLENGDTLFPISLACLLVQVFFLTSNLTETSFEYGKVRTVLLLAWAISFALYKNRGLVAKPQKTI